MPPVTSTRVRTRRRGVAAGLAVLVAATVAGCEQPSPGVSVFSGTTTAHRQALCWAFESDNLAPGQCARDIVDAAIKGGEVARIPVVPGDTIGISVDTAVAEAGWRPVIGEQPLVQQPLTQTYYRFTFPDLQQVPADGLPLEIVAGRDTRTRGMWVFKLVPAQG